ncbi:TetR/AcrR family transcriptional regulator [Agromyces agglutinans]|uniref:TetR/AcrR family transcriptional regulator n=1 Tax=Agromyces agglutinans TaxID=2662258 RepID=UPI001561D8B7|nr:TetR/AcrR family transcriptional regulator [Agromyces agglutinans]
MSETTQADSRGKPAAERVQRPQARTLERREAVLKAALKVFGAHGYHKGALVEVAEEAGMTHAGVLHHFGSKEGLLIAMLKYRDGEEAAGVPARAQTEGPAFLQHLVDTVQENTTRRGVVQAYTVLSGESVADGHPAHDYFGERTHILRAKIAGVFGEVTGSTDEQALADAASTLIAVMDGLQLQWLLEPEAVEMPRLVASVIDELIDRLSPPVE